MGWSDKGLAGSRGGRIGQEANDLYIREVLVVYIRPTGQTAGMDTGLSPWTAGYPYALWVDNNVTCPKSYIPAGWTECAIWQYARTDDTGNIQPTI